MFDSVIDFLYQNVRYAYPILFLGSLLESFFPPYPSDGVFVFSAFLAGQGILDGRKAFALVCAGNFIGVLSVYWLGLKGVRPRLSRWISSQESLSKADQWFQRYGDKVVLLNRFIPGVRSPLCFAAGVFGLAPAKMTLYSLVSVLLWNGLLLSISFWAGRTTAGIERFFFRYSLIAGMVTAGVVVWILLRFVRRRR